MNKILVICSILMLGGCSLSPGENRKVTAWGVWCSPGACGVGYWHSERGPDVVSEESARPGLPK